MSTEEEAKPEQSKRDSKSDKLKDENGDKEACDDWQRVRSAIEHENTLVNLRLTRFATVQGLLFTAFGLIFNAHASSAPGSLGTPYLLLLAIGFLGVLLCIAVLVPLHEARKQIISLDCKS